MKLTEAQITKQIRDYLNIKRIFHYKAWQGMMSKKGVSDIIACYKGRFIAIEVKTEKGRVSDAQQQFLEAVTASGGVAILARSVDDVIEGLKK